MPAVCFLLYKSILHSILEGNLDLTALFIACRGLMNGQKSNQFHGIWQRTCTPNVIKYTKQLQDVKCEKMNMISGSHYDFLNFLGRDHKKNNMYFGVMWCRDEPQTLSKALYLRSAQRQNSAVLPIWKKILLKNAVSDTEAATFQVLTPCLYMSEQQTSALFPNRCNDMSSHYAIFCALPCTYVSFWQILTFW